MPLLVKDQLPETHHLWVWINEPQHAAAVQAVLGIITTVASIAAAFAALKAYLSSIEQVRLANEQLKVARRQANAAQRPFLVVEMEGVEISSHVRAHILMVHNQGAGPVTNAFWIRDDELRSAQDTRSEPAWTRIGSISLGGRSGLQLHNSEKFASTIGSGIWIHYQDLEGTKYFCFCTETRLGSNCDNGELADGEPSPLRQDLEEVR